MVHWVVEVDGSNPTEEGFRHWKYAINAWSISGSEVPKVYSPGNYLRVSLNKQCQWKTILSFSHFSRTKLFQLCWGAYPNFDH